MKKFLCVLIAVVIALTSITIIASADTPNITMTADKTNVNAGDVITVTVKVAKDSNLAAATLDVVYDNAFFELVSGSLKPTEAMGATINENYAENKARYIGVLERQLKDESTLFTIQFKVLKRGGSITLEASEVYHIVGLRGERTDVTAEVKESLKDDVIKVNCPHADNNVSEIASTCTADGRKVETCNECGFVKDTVIPKLPHDGRDFTVKEATCKEKGVEGKKCVVCSTVYDEKETDVIDHKMEWTVTKPATCTENGEETLKCTMCDHSTEKREIVAVGAHDLKDNVTKEVTCEEDGLKTQYCTKCDYVNEGIVIPKTGHTPGEWVVAKKPTTKEEGLEEKKCTTCNKVLESRKLEKLDEYVLGDVNRDNYVTAVDARFILQNVAGLKEFTPTQNAAGDVNGDGKITAVDARFILQYVAGLVKF